TELPSDPDEEAAASTSAEALFSDDDPIRPPVLESETLIGQEPTAAAWRGVRNRLQTKFNKLREGMRLPTDAWDIDEALDNWHEDVDLYEEYAVSLALDDID